MALREAAEPAERLVPAAGVERLGLEAEGVEIGVGRAALERQRLGPGQQIGADPRSRLGP
jgi:hypothetical protein